MLLTVSHTVHARRSCSVGPQLVERTETEVESAPAPSDNRGFSEERRNRET